MSSEKNAIPLARFDKFSRLKPSNQQEQEHYCIFDCEFMIPFDEPLLVPSNCREELTMNACEVDIKVELGLNFTTFSFSNTTIDLIIDDVRIDNFSAEIVAFEFDHTLLSYILAYKCSYGDRCEWNYIKEKLPTIINHNYQPLFNSLSLLIYNDKPQTNVTHCYSLNELIDCQSGVCDFTESLDLETLELTNIRECLIFTRPKIYFGHYRYAPDPLKYNFDYLYFACNINECNSLSNEHEIKRVIGFIEHKNMAFINTGHLYVVVSFYFIISVLRSFFFFDK